MDEFGLIPLPREEAYKDLNTPEDVGVENIDYSLLTKLAYKKRQKHLLREGRYYSGKNDFTKYTDCANCLTKVVQEEALPLVVSGETYYLCGDNCLQDYRGLLNSRVIDEKDSTELIQSLETISDSEKLSSLSKITKANITRVNS